ncbi:MAG: methyltransferase [Candidatus Solibacter sp.]|nr:methyltransferase [Candidatus Solibacter sp.]
MPGGAGARRLAATLRHERPEQIPIDLGSTAVTGIHVTCVCQLRDYFGLAKLPVKVHEPYQMLGWIDDDLVEALGIDTAGVFPRENMFGFANENWKEWSFRGLDVLVGGNFRVVEEPGGDILIFPKGDTSAAPSGRMPVGSAFFDTIVRQAAFDENNLDPADNLEEFGAISEADLEHVARSVDRANSTGRGVVATFGGTAFGDIALVPGPFMTNPKGIRDITEWYVSTRSRRPYIHQIFERQCEIGMANLARIHERVGNTVQAVFVCGTDFGTQTSAFCSDATFRELWLPYYKRVNDWIHADTAWKSFKHSCGSVVRFLDSFIDAGFDILNPVQCSARGMDPATLKSKYGGRLTFWGGGVDTQKTLPFGTPGQVREEVLRRCEIFSSDGGFVFNPIHNIQAGTPVENIVAMLNAVQEFNGVKHG